MTKNQDDPEQTQTEPIADGRNKPVPDNGVDASSTLAWSFYTFEESSSSIEITITHQSDETTSTLSKTEPSAEIPMNSNINRTHQESDTWDSKNPPIFSDEKDSEQDTGSLAIYEECPVEINSQSITSESLSRPLPDGNLDDSKISPDIRPDAATHTVGESEQAAEQQVTEKEVVIEFENVTKSFYNQMVLRNLSFKIHKGETVCLIGESGCGKTVNLKLMIGLIRPDKGDVRFHGQSLSKMNEKQITATRIKFGFLFQMAALFDSMSIYDNVAFGLREHRMMPESEMPGYIQERLSEVGLPQGVELKKPAELSGGQRKRVGLARALALQPEVMLYDEPTTGLDPIMTDIINELIIQTQNHGERSGIIVTHEMRTVIKCADRVIMLYPISRLGPDENQILYDGPPHGMEQSPDPRVRQFVLGEAGDRLKEMSMERLAEESDTGLIPMDPSDIVAARPVKPNS